MKSFLSLSLMVLILSSSNAYSQKKIDFDHIKTSVETFVHDIFDKDKRAERKAQRIERRKQRRLQRSIRRQNEVERNKPMTYRPVASKPLPVLKAKEPSCSLYDSIIPQCYNKRDQSELKVALLYYGDYMTLSDLNRIEPILKDRFYRATGNQISLDIISKKILNFKHALPENYRFNEITDKKRLHRIWYSENVGTQIMNEVYEEYKKYESKATIDKLDAVAAITGAQFEGLGFASGRVSVTEYPREIAWNADDGGRVDYISDYEIVDELIHELGHNLYLGHTSEQCQKRGMTYEEKIKCCEQSENRDDVLSYCRQRSDVNESFMHGFESCNRQMIETSIVPALLSGGKWQFPNRLKCQ